MAALVGTVKEAGRSGEIGGQRFFLGEYDLAAALVNADTITWSNILPSSGTFKVLDFKIVAPELDTNATPTMLFVVGDGTDNDAFLTSKGGAVGLQNSLAGQLSYFGDGAAIGAAAGTVVGRDIVLTVTAAVATGATSGKIRVSGWTQAV